MEQQVNNEVSDAESKSEDEEIESNDPVSKPKVDLDKQIIELSDDELEESQLGLFNKLKAKYVQHMVKKLYLIV